MPTKHGLANRLTQYGDRDFALGRPFNPDIIIIFLLTWLLITKPVSAQDEGFVPITLQNAPQVETVQVLGQGYVNEAIGWWGDEIVLSTSTGFWFYDPDDLNAPPRPLHADGSPAIVNPWPGIEFSGDSLVYLDGDQNLYLVDQNGDQQVVAPEIDDPQYHEIAISPDGRLVALTTRLGILVEDLQNRQYINFLRTYFGPDGIAFSPDGTKVATHGNGTPSSVIGLYICPIIGDGCWSEDAVRLDLPADAPRKLDWEFPAADIAFSPDGSLIAAVFVDGLVSLWSLADEQLVAYTFVDPVNLPEQMELSFSPNGSQLLVVKKPGATISVWNVEDVITSGEFGDAAMVVIAPLTDYPYIVDIEFNPSGTQLVFLGWIGSSYNHTLGLLDLGDGRMIDQTFIDLLSGRRVLLSATGDRLVLQRSDRLDLWSLNESRPLNTVKINEEVVSAVMSTDGTHVTASLESALLPCSTMDSAFECNDPLRTVEGIHATAYGESNYQLAALNADGAIRYWNLDSRVVQSVVSLDDYPPQISVGTFSDDLSLVATGSGTYEGSADNSVRVWDTASGDLLATLDGHTSRITGIDFSPDGQRIAAISDFCVVRVWVIQSGKLLQTLGEPIDRRFNEYMLPGLDFSSDGILIASAWKDELRIWDAANSTMLFQAETGHPIVTGLTFSDDGTRLLTTGLDGVVRVWAVGNS